MSKVVTFSHCGIRGVIPGVQASQVADRPPPDERIVQLWPGALAEASHWLCGQGKLGRVWLCCSEVQLDDLEATRLLALSELLRKVLGSLPHVVGSVQIDSGHAWLVDLTRLEEERA